MSAQCIAAAHAWLADHARLSPEARSRLAGLTPELLAALPAARPAAVGVAGPPGTGKSTLAGMLAAALAEAGTPAAVLSLDHYYLDAARRRQMARNLHPLFAVRGVPGTHDLSLLLEHLERLLTGDTAGLALPRFDKAADDRRAEPRPWTGPAAPAIVLLEGWMVGAPPQPAAELVAPLNALEREQDPDGRWRRQVNRYLAAYHEALRPRLAARWYLRAPRWASVVAWRWQQERERAATTGHQGFDSEQAVRGFLAHFERIGRHMQAHCEEWADLVIRLDAQHRARLTCLPDPP